MAIVACDVNETLLSPDPLHDAVASVPGPDVPSAWFARLLHGSLVASHLDGPAWWLPGPGGATATTIAEVADHL
jgi:hypothetical protein